MITYDDFKKVDIRVGKVIHVETFPTAKKPALKTRLATYLFIRRSYGR